MINLTRSRTSHHRSGCRHTPSGLQAHKVKARWVVIALLTCLLYSLLVADNVRGQPIPDPLRALAQANGIQVGAAVAITPLRNQPEYQTVLAREFNALTPENAMKFAVIHPDRDRYDFAAADEIVTFAQQHDMTVRGHTLVWHQQLPGWLTQTTWQRQELLQILKQHITTVVTRYRGQVAAWDVVNEAIADDGSLRDSFWLKALGPDYIALAFRWAHAADPTATLFYNDYGAEGLQPKSDSVYALVKQLQAQGIPIQGVGLQMHITNRDYPPIPDIADNMRRLADLGLVTDITELDIRLQQPTTDAALGQQADLYQAMLLTCLEARRCQRFTLWGFTDRYSWVPTFFKGWGSALIFDDTYQAKPSYIALSSGLRQFKQPAP